MKTRLTLIGCFTVTIFLIYFGTTYAQEIKLIKLLTAQMEGGKPLMQVLKDRKSMR